MAGSSSFLITFSYWGPYLTAVIAEKIGRKVNVHSNILNCHVAYWAHLLKQQLPITVYCLPTKENKLPFLFAANKRKLTFSVFSLQQTRNCHFPFLPFSIYSIYIHMYINTYIYYNIYIYIYCIYIIYIHIGGRLTS